MPRTAAVVGSPPRLRWGGCPSLGCLHFRRTGSASALRIDREAFAQCADAFADISLDLRIALFAILAKPVENVGDHVADLAELARAEAARGAGGRADAD